MHGFEIIPEKFCRYCGLTKAISDFHKNKSLPDGHSNKCKSCGCAYSRAWHKENRERSKAKSKRFNAALKTEVLEHYGNVCVCCGESVSQFLTLDHINNDGAEQRKTTGSGTNFYLWAKRSGYPDDLEVLCFNCNCGRQVNGGVCPHDGV